MMRKFKSALLISLTICVSSLFSQDPRVEPQIVWQIHATRTDWTNFIAFDHVDLDGFYDLAVSNFKRTSARTLTRGIPGLPQRHIGNPTIHTSGRYIIFQTQKDSTLGGEENKAWFTYVFDSYIGSPGKGFDNDMWCVDLLDNSFYRLTTLPTKKSLLDTTKVTAILHPHFSKDGTKVLWAQAFDALADIGGRGKWGLWQLNISDFVVKGGKPSLQNTISYKPGGLLGDFTWCESHSWTKNDSVVIFSMNSEGQHDNHMDIYTLNIYDSTLTKLTDNYKTWDEHAQLTPDEKQLIYICSQGYDFDTTRAEATLRTDYWLMNTDGSNKKRLTFFNDPAHPDHQIYGGQRIICGDASFSPNGDSLLINTKVPDDTLNYASENIMFALFHPGKSSIEFLNKEPGTLELYQNYPNPFNNTTRITYSILQPCFVTLKIYDMRGREIQTLVDEFQKSDTYSVTLDTGELPSGVYFYTLRGGKSIKETKKMLLLK
jgi:hypothetical protein